MKKLIIILFLLYSCTAKKTVIEYKERVVKDTINVEVVKTVIKPIKETLIVEQPCDSLGVLKPFEKEIKTEKATIRVYNDKGSIKAEINIDSIVDLKVNKFKSNYQLKVDTKEKTIIRYKYPLWLITYSVLITIILGLFIRFR